MTEADPSFDRGRPGALQRFFFRAPAYVYRGALAEIMRKRCVMLLTTTGRRTGQPRTTGVSFMPQDGGYVIFSGWGVRSDWYRNIQRNPTVTLRVGRRRVTATARPVTDPARRRALMVQMRARSAQCGPPEPVRTLLRRLGLFDYDAELDLAVAQGEALPVVELVPETATR